MLTIDDFKVGDWVTCIEDSLWPERFPTGSEWLVTNLITTSDGIKHIQIKTGFPESDGTYTRYAKDYKLSEKQGKERELKNVIVVPKKKVEIKVKLQRML